MSWVRGPVRGLLGGKDPTGRFGCRSTSLPVVTQNDAEPLVVQQKGVDRPAEVNEEGLVRILLSVRVDHDRDGHGRFARGEGERPGNRDIVVAAGRGGAVCGGV